MKALMMTIHYYDNLPLLPVEPPLLPQLEVRPLLPLLTVSRPPPRAEMVCTLTPDTT